MLSPEAEVWEPLTGTVQGLKQSGGVLAARFSPDGRRIITASPEAPARVWDAQSLQPLAASLKNTAPINAARISLDGKRVVTCSPDYTARVWDAQTGQPLTERLRHPEPLACAQISPDGTQLLTVSGQGTAWVWDIAPAATNCPAWLLKLAAVVANEAPDAEKLAQAPERDPLELLAQVRKALQEAPEDDWTRWGRWLLADRSRRALSPRSTRTVPQYIEALIKEAQDAVRPSGVPVTALYSLAEAAALAIGDATLVAQIAEVRARLDLLLAGLKSAEAQSWKEATDAFAKLVEMEPMNVFYHHSLSLLLVKCGERDAYQRHCGQVLAQFSGTKDPLLAEQAVLCCLLLPPGEENLKAIRGLTKVGASSQTNRASDVWDQFVQALAEYRQGHFGEAEQLLQKVTAQREGLAVEANAVLAMAQHQMSKSTESLASLANAESNIKRQPNFGWEAAVFTRALFDEAKALLESTPQAAGPKP